MKSGTFLFFLFSIIMLNPHSAHAYIEPGFGSLLIQALLGGLVGGIVIFKSYWYKITSFFSKKNR